MIERQEKTTFPLPISNNDRASLLSAYPRVDAIFREYAERYPVPGIAYGIVIENELVYAGGVGFQNVVEQSPVTQNSVFRIASMTKSFTAMALIKLRDEGKLQLDAPAADYVPELATLHYPTHDSTPITVRQLLTMSAGLPQDDPWADRQLAVSEEGLSKLLRNGISFSNPPGIKFEYSNFGYAILGRIVTNVSGSLYQAYVTREIFNPLGMSSTTFDVSAISPERLAIGYRRENDAWIEEPPLSDGAFASIGGLFTTIADFARYMSFLLSAFPARDDTDHAVPIRRSSAREMQQIWRPRFVVSTRQTPDLPAFVQSEGYGYGLACGIDSVLGYSVSHGGGLPGYGSFYRLLPEYGIGIAAFTNVTYNPVALRINEAFTALRKTGGMKPRTLPPTPALITIQQTITRLYENWDDQTITAIATDSFFLDMPMQKRREQIEQLRASFGKCKSTTDLEPENALRGRWIMKCKAGQIEVFATLAPTNPPQLQVLQFISAKPLSPALRESTAQIISLIHQWDAQKARALFARSVKLAAIQSQFEALRVQYGNLRASDVLEGDGQTQARLRLVGKYGNVEMKLLFEAKSHKVEVVTFLKPRESLFVP